MTAEMPAQPRLNVEALKPWLKKTLNPGGDIAIASLEIPPTGYSAITGLLDVDIPSEGNAEHRALVLRLEKVGEHVFTDTDIVRQGEMMRALRDNGIPAPNVVGIESDPETVGGKFLVMDRVDGVSLPQKPNYHVAGLLPELSPAARGQLWEEAVSTIAGINRLDWRQGFEFLNKPQYGEPGLEQYLGWLAAWRDEAMEGQANPVIDQAIATLIDDKPENPHVDVLWGDSNPGNFLFTTEGHVAAVLDFEAAALGPAEIDLAWWFFMDQIFSFGHERVSGLPSREAQIALYESVLGRKVADLAYFELLAAVRIGLVLARTTHVLIHAGRLPPDNRAAFNNPATQLLAMQLGIDGGEAGEDYAAFETAMNDR